MSRWFRLYAEVLNDPKVQKLAPEDFRSWVNLLCLACENDGKIPSVSDVSFALRMSEDGVLTLLERLSSGTLIDRMSGGPDGWHYAPHCWAKRQYKSDTSTERVKRFRERSATVSETPPEADTDTEQNTPTSVGVARAPKTKAVRFVPGDWSPSFKHEETAASEGMTMEQMDYQATRFREHEFKKPITNVDLAFHRWIRTAKDFGNGNARTDAKLAARHENYRASWSGSEQAADLLAARRNL